MNNFLTIQNLQLTMSSLEISELTSKNHSDVMRDIRNMLEHLELSTQQFCGVYKASNGQTYECFNLDKENTLILISGYNVKIRQVIIRRWQELENKQIKLPVTYLEALKELVSVTEENERLNALNNALIHIEKTFTTSELAKELNMKSAKQLNKVLEEKKIQYKLNKTWLLSAKYSDLGKSYYNSQWTNKGRSFILELLK